MKCCFSGSETPVEKLLVLYYPPTMAHQGWEKSVYAAARAREVVKQTIRRLEGCFWRYVVGKKLLVGLLVGALGLAVLLSWGRTALSAWDQTGFFTRYGPPLVALMLMAFAWFRLRRFLNRMRRWKAEGKKVVADELTELKQEAASMPDDPTAEEAAHIMRRQCPDVVSELAFDGTYFRAFTYMDFVMFPQLKHPVRREELPDKHSLQRDAYYVGDIVYDSWRVFQKDQRELIDARFAGSGGRRGVI